MIGNYNAKLSKTKKISKEIKRYAFEFNTDFNFTPGQFITLTFKDDPSISRSYSIASTPNKNKLEVVIKTRGEFTKKLDKAKPGTEFIIKGPFGDFTIKPEMKKIAFLAGGIGYTPFRSMIFSESGRKSDVEMCMIYSARTHKDICDKRGFEKLAKSYGKFKFVKCLTREAEYKEKNTYNERISAEIISKEIPNYKGYYFFICGKKEMIENMRGLLNSIGIPKEQIKVENWG